MSNLIFQYTREQAIDDGVLIDITAMARQAGIRYPVAVTSSLWGKYVEVPYGLEGEQDENGRLWDILVMFTLAAKGASESPWLEFELLVKNDPTEPPKGITLKAHVGPGDGLEPVITIMLPGED